MRTLDHSYLDNKKEYKSYLISNNNLIESEYNTEKSVIHLKDCYYKFDCFKNDEFIIYLYSDIFYNNFKKNVINAYNHEKCNSNNIYINDKLYLWKVNVTNYLHFIRDGVPVLEDYFVNNEYKDSKILIMQNKDLIPNYVFQFLEHLNFINNIIFIDDLCGKSDNIIFKNLCIPIFNNTKKIKFYKDYKIVKKIESLVHKFKLPNELKFNKIYVSRRTWIRIQNENIGEDNTQKRKLLNEDELVKYLEEKNYKELFLEDYDFITKLAILNNSKNIVTTYGAGVINFIFTQNINYYILNSPSYGLNGLIKNIISIENDISDFNFYAYRSSEKNCKWTINMDGVKNLIDNL
jgi:hypothetical protein